MRRKEDLLLSKLDTVLQHLCNEFESGKNAFRHSREICEYAGLSISPNEAYLILDKLNMDNYVEVSFENNRMFQLNYNGVVFVAKGGYIKQLEDLRTERLKKRLHNGVVIFGIIVGAIFSVYKIIQGFS